MKKIFILLGFGLSAIAMAQSGNINQDFADALIIERAFVVGSLTSIEGEHDSTRRGNFINRYAAFCFSKNNEEEIEETQIQKMFTAAKQFRREFNSLAPKRLRIKHIGTNCQHPLEITLSFVPHLGGNAAGRWSCSEGIEILSQCNIKFLANYPTKWIVPHEMFNILGFNDTYNQLFHDCVLYDNKHHGKFSKNGKLCDIEKRLIPFKFTKTGLNWDANLVIRAFNKHWKTSRATKKLIKTLQFVRREGSGLSPKTQLEIFCRIMFTPSHCRNVLKDDAHWFCHPHRYGDASFCRKVKKQVSGVFLSFPGNYRKSVGLYTQSLLK